MIVIHVASGVRVSVPDSRYAEFAGRSDFQIVGAPQQTTTAGGGPTVDPTVPYQQWLANYYLNLADTQSTRMNAQTNQFNAGTNQLGTLGSLYASMRGDPANWANYANLLRGRTKADYPAFVGALSGLTSGLSDQSIDTSQLGVSNFGNANFGVINPGGGASGSMQTAAEQAGSASQIGGTDAFGNPVNLFARQNGSRDLNGIGYEQTGPNAIGNPRRNLESLGLDPIGPNGEWNGPTWDASGSPVYPPGYDGPAWPRMPTNAIEEAQWNDWVRNGMVDGEQPAYDPSVATSAAANQTAAGTTYEGTKAKAAAAQAVGSNRYKATDQDARVAAEAARDALPADRVAREAAARAGESAADRQYREYFESTAHGQAALQAGKVIANQQTGGGFAGQPTTVYTFGDGSQTEYRNIDGATVSHGSKPGSGSGESNASKGSANSSAGSPSSSSKSSGQADSGNTSPKPAAPSAGRSGGAAGGPSPSTARPSTTSVPAYKPTVSRTTYRAAGGADLSSGPIDFAQMAMDARAAPPPMAPTTPGVSIVTQPTMIDRPGPADILTGEPQPEFPGAEDGGDELVLVIPLQNPDVGVEPWVADLANQQAGQPLYQPRPGPKPAWLQSITAGVTGQPSMLMPPSVEGADPMLDPLAKSPMPLLGMAHGGATVSVGKTAIRPISSRSVTLNPANKPFTLTDQERKLGLYPNGKYVSESGQVQAPSSTKPGSYTTIPQFSAVPLPSPLDMPARAARAVLKSPLEMALLDSILKARGRGDGASFWAQYFGAQRTQRSPIALGTRRLF